MYWSHPCEPIETLHEYTEREAEDERRAVRIDCTTKEAIARICIDDEGTK